MQSLEPVQQPFGHFWRSLRQNLLVFKSERWMFILLPVVNKWIREPTYSPWWVTVALFALVVFQWECSGSEFVPWDWGAREGVLAQNLYSLSNCLCRYSYTLGSETVSVTGEVFLLVQSFPHRDEFHCNMSIWSPQSVPPGRQFPLKSVPVTGSYGTFSSLFSLRLPRIFQSWQ